MYTSDVQVLENMLHREIHAKLRDVARRALIVSYSDIAPLASLDMDNPEHGDQKARSSGSFRPTSTNRAACCSRHS
jgi:hypothetical protein